jgi:hypothetical protein
MGYFAQDAQWVTNEVIAFDQLSIFKQSAAEHEKDFVSRPAQSSERKSTDAVSPGSLFPMPRPDTNHTPLDRTSEWIRSKDCPKGARITHHHFDDAGMWTDISRPNGPCCHLKPPSNAKSLPFESPIGIRVIGATENESAAIRRAPKEGLHRPYPVPDLP